MPRHLPAQVDAVRPFQLVLVGPLYILSVPLLETTGKPWARDSSDAFMRSILGAETNTIKA